MEHILVVEDDKRLRRLFREILEVEGYRVSEAEHGAKALDVLMLQSIDLVLLDMMMPVMDGLEFLAACELRLGGQQPAVLAMSASPTLLHDALRHGAQATIAKPFEIAAFLDIVESLKRPAAPNNDVAASSSFYLVG